MTFEFQCATCGKIHNTPSFIADAPFSFYALPEENRRARSKLGTDDCIIDYESYFVLGCIEIPPCITRPAEVLRNIAGRAEQHARPAITTTALVIQLTNRLRFLSNASLIRHRRKI